jgi:hypothetical protein
MTDTTAHTKITLKSEAVQFIQALPAHTKTALIDFIRTEAQRTSKQMVINGMTCTIPDHIYRCMKWYVTCPTIRIIFHCTRDGISITRIAYRCDDPYGDGH